MSWRNNTTVNQLYRRWFKQPKSIREVGAGGVTSTNPTEWGSTRPCLQCGQQIWSLPGSNMEPLRKPLLKGRSGVVANTSLRGVGGLYPILLAT